MRFPALFVVKPLRIPREKLREICVDMSVKFHLSDAAVSVFKFLMQDSTVFGLILLALAVTYVGTSLLHRGSLKIMRWTVPVPPPVLTLQQIGIASADMLIAAGVFYVLCPHVRGGYFRVLEVYLVAYVLNVISHVPGGWGVIEATITGSLSALELVAREDIPKVFAAIVVFRVVYFLLPLLVASLMLAWHEYALRRNWIPPIAAHEDMVVPGDASSAAANGQPQSHPGKMPTDKKR